MSVRLHRTSASALALTLASAGIDFVIVDRLVEGLNTSRAAVVHARTLEVLEELGLVRHAHLSDRAPTYHSVSGHEHFHLVCRNCRHVISVDPDVLLPLLTTLKDDHGFSVDVGHLTVFGTCEDCS